MKANNDPAIERSYALRMPAHWQPPVPAWSSSFEESQTGVSMAVIGLQHRDFVDMAVHRQTLFEALQGAEIRDLVTSDAGGGYQETFCIAYWRDATSAEATLSGAQFAKFWQTHKDAGEFGLIKECINVPFQRTETLFSGPEHKHGYSQMRTGAVGPIQQHQYWGGMRDRIALSAHDRLNAGSTSEALMPAANHIVIEPQENLCIIRSGQDWSACDAEQLSEYTDMIEPTLNEGMNFLRDEGASVHCYSCRYMKDFELDGSMTKRSCGLAYFRTMEDLENWAEHHPSHLKIFHTFLSIAPKHGPNLQLRLWHEVSVLPSEGCRAEYINCRPGTGWTAIQ